MLTGSLVRVRFVRQRIVPVYAATDDPAHLELAGRLLESFRGREGMTRGELLGELAETFGERTGQFVQQGLIKLLEDLCDFEVVADHPPEALREQVFQVAAARRAAGQYERAVVLQEVANELGLAPGDVDTSLFADLKGEQQIVKFTDTTPERLLQRYNVALAQAVLLRAVGVTVEVRDAPPAQMRRLCRAIKFRRLVCEVDSTSGNSCRLRLDGPMSLFSSTQRYGLQLALFLPTLLPCRDFELTAELRWGPQRKAKTFTLSPAEALVSHQPEPGSYVPPELAMFAEQFRKKDTGWVLHEVTAIFPLGNSFWVPDYRLEHAASGRAVYLEVLGFWRRSSAEAHLRRLKEHAPWPFLLAVSDQLKIDDADLDGLPAEVVRFRSMPLPEEVAKRAARLIGV